MEIIDKILFNLAWFGISTPDGVLNPNIGTEALLNTYITNILNTIIGISGLVAVAVIIFGAISMITASGDPENIAKAQTMITNAIIGLIVASVAFVLVNFVIVNFAQM